MSQQVFSAKELDGDVAMFLRFDGDKFIVDVNGEERTVAREIWLKLPDSPRMTHPAIDELSIMKRQTEKR